MDRLKVLVAGTPVVDDVVQLAEQLPKAVPALTSIFSKLQDAKYTFKGSSKPKAATPQSSAAAKPGSGAVKGPQVVVFDNMSCLSPRGRFNVGVGPDGHVTLTKKATPNDVFARIGRNEVQHVLHIEKLDRQGHVQEHVWILCLPEEHASSAVVKKPFVAFKSTLTAADRKYLDGWPDVTLQINATNLPAAALEEDKQLFDGDSTTGKAPDIISRILQAVVRPVCHTSYDVFRTSDKNGHKSNCMPCYYKVRDGALYPLSAGLLFLQTPVLFLPVHKIEEIYCGRGGVATTKNFDLVVSVGGQSYEFSMIEREHQGAVAAYVDFVKRAQKSRKKNGGRSAANDGAARETQRGENTAADVDGQDEDSDDDEDDEESFTDPDSDEFDPDRRGSSDDDDDDDDDSVSTNDGAGEGGSDTDTDDDEGDDDVGKDELRALVDDGVKHGDFESEAAAKAAAAANSKRARRAKGRPKATGGRTVVPRSKGVKQASVSGRPKPPGLARATSTKPRSTNKVKAPRIHSKATKIHSFFHKRPRNES